MATLHNQGLTQDTEHKIVINVPEELLSTLRNTCAEKASVSLLGRIQGKHPGLKALTAWARETLHPSLLLLSLKANNLFEVTFSTAEGRTHALTQADLNCEAANITFASWRPHFDAKTQQAQEQLDCPVWMQVVDLCQIMREEKFLRTIGDHIGQVIAIDNSEMYRAKLFGPRIRLLVKDPNNLPKTIVVPRLDREGVVEYSLEYSGLPNQCGRCRSRDHQVRNCPKKESKTYRKTQPHTAQPDPPPAPESLTGSKENPSSAPEREGIQQETHETQVADESQGTKTDPVTVTTAPMDLQPAATTPDPPELQPEDSHPEPPPDLPPRTENTELLPELQPNDQNFPQLSSPGTTNKPTVQPPTPQQPGTPQAFIWRQKPPTATPSTDKGKEKSISDSAPLTRQGYRSGRLADDFWGVLNIPGTPSSQRKKLKILPFLTKNFTHSEFLADNSNDPPSTITVVHIAEILAGVPWSEQRAKQHIVNETAQALHKVLIFNNQHNTPFQKWDQGCWFSQWSMTEEGEHLCTLYVSIAAPENKIRIRKGRNFSWRNVPTNITTLLTSTQTEQIQDVADLSAQWQDMAGQRDTPTNLKAQPATPKGKNPFSILRMEDESTS